MGFYRQEYWNRLHFLLYGIFPTQGLKLSLLHCSCLENPRDGGAWWAVVSGVAQSRTRLKRLSSSSSSSFISRWILYHSAIYSKEKNFKLKKKTTKSGNSSDSAPRTEKNADLNFMHLRSKQIKYVLHSKQGNGKTLSLIMIFSSFSQDSAIIIGWNPPDSRERWQFLSFSSNSSSVILKSSKSHEVFSKSPVPSLAHRGKDQYKQWWWLHLNQLSMKINDGHRKRGER